MKWFFATNQSSLDNPADDWTRLIKAAVRSCKANTTLEPCFLFDGEENDLTAWLRAEGVTVYFHRSSLYPALVRQCETPEGFNIGQLQIASAAYLRVDIPEIVPDEQFVLYTDCDVIFLQDPLSDISLPKILSCGPQLHRGKFSDLNSGVMVLNIQFLLEDLTSFREFIIRTLDFDIDYDQIAYKHFYRDRYNLLPDELNWKPYWGSNTNARIVHFHGPKPSVVEQMLASESFRTYQIYHKLFNANRLGYVHYSHIWKYFYDAACQTNPSQSFK